MRQSHPYFLAILGQFAQDLPMKAGKIIDYLIVIFKSKGNYTPILK
jgi:hypothetical protein